VPEFFTMQFFTVTPVLPVRLMPTPEGGPVMECPAQFRVMLSAPIVMPVLELGLVEQFRLPVSVVLPVMLLPHDMVA
jgi:hypothetical protein